jgi:hypothetical protein
VVADTGRVGTNGFAIASLTMGVLGLSALPLIGAVLALIFGHRARREIANSGESGEGLATAGVILGWVGLGLAALLLLAAAVAIVFLVPVRVETG